MPSKKTRTPPASAPEGQPALPLQAGDAGNAGNAGNAGGTAASTTPAAPALPPPAPAPAPGTAVSPAAPFSLTTGAAPHRFPIVGLGASAGGLEALEQFFRAVPAGIGMAFVVVQHLDPSHPSILAEILQRSSLLPVLEVQDQMQVEADHVYVIPPNRDLAILHRVLQLHEPIEARGHRLPIDGFLRSLAEDQAENSAGIILSGTGSDGTLGLRAIYGAGGLCLAQDIATARYDGMPSSAIAAGYVNRILVPDAMPQTLLETFRSAAHLPAAVKRAPSAGLNRILMLLRATTGHDFSLYKISTVGRRIERRMTQHGIADADAYARYLKEHPAELQTMFRELLINVTSFFRDPLAFEVLKTTVLKDLLASKADGDGLRIWVAGCASGEEAYSIAILLRELMDEIHTDVKVQLYATDLDDDAITTARLGFYTVNIAQDLTPERLGRFFSREDNGLRIKKEIREMVVFAVQSITRDPPFTRLDLLTCRNLLIYLQPELQDRVIRSFHYAVKPGGALMLSPSESVGEHTNLFEPISRKWKLYRATAAVGLSRGGSASVPTWSGVTIAGTPSPAARRPRELQIADLAKRALLQIFAPAAVVTDLQGTVLYVHGDCGRYLRPAPGQPSYNLVGMARDGLQLALREALRQAAQGVVILNQTQNVQIDGQVMPVNLSLRPLIEANAPLGMLLVSFQDQPDAPPLRPVRKRRGSVSVQAQNLMDLESELAFAREGMSVVLEAQQASNEEHKATNEELQSANEELQSTNEEMETSKEELQSVNEELITVNAELQTKIEFLAMMQDDMKNLLESIRLGTIFVDRRLVIRRFTRDATQVYPLVPSDVGRPLADIRSEVNGGDLVADAQTVLDTLLPIERDIVTNTGVWYLARIRPYRTVDDVIDGVVMTFADTTDRVVQQIATRKALKLAEAVVDTVREPLMVLDGDLRVLSANRAFLAAFGSTAAHTVGRRIFDIGDGDRDWNLPALHDLLERRLPIERSFEQAPLQLSRDGAHTQRLWLSARRIVEANGESPLVLLRLDDEPAAKGPA